MSLPRIVRIIIALALLCSAQLAYGKPPTVSFAGGDGSSFDKAIIIRGATEESGVHAEYVYIQRLYPGYKRSRQLLVKTKGRVYDILDFTTAARKKKTMYFDITAFYGKWS